MARRSASADVPRAHGDVVLIVERQGGERAVAAAQAAVASLLEQRPGRLVPIAHAGDRALNDQRAVRREGVAGGLRAGPGLDAQLPGGIEVEIELHERQQEQALPPDPVVVVERCDLEAALRVVDDARELAAHLSERSRAHQQPRLDGRAVVGRQVDRPPEEVQALVAVAVLVPEPDKRRRQPAPTVGIGPGQAPVQCRSEVVVLGLDPVEAGVLAGAFQLGLGRFAEREEIVEVALKGRVPFPGGVQPADRVLPDRLEQPVPGFALVLVDDDQGLVDQTAQGGQHLGLRDWSLRAVGAQGSGGVEGEPAGERAETTEHHSVGLVEQVVAPVHRGGEGLLAPGGAAGPAHQQREPVVEPGCDLRRGERAQPRRRELDRERDPVQAPAQCADGRLIGGVQREPGTDAARPIDEQRHRLLLLEGRHAATPSHRRRPAVPGLSPAPTPRDTSASARRRAQRWPPAGVRSCLGTPGRGDPAVAAPAPAATRRSARP